MGTWIAMDEKKGISSKKKDVLCPGLPMKKRKILFESWGCPITNQDAESKSENEQPLQLEHMKRLFSVLGIGLCLGTAIFAMELTAKKIGFEV